ncbi:MlaD family protein [Sphingomonas sp. BGYR3]|uniref:MlaD family protein n=1 Tax=Sphingomonas sp. BGYR3 TaxID=2975483 RepID=UPI0021A5128B|nr:MlaD family protein [Sphingomonas sp. BGYR3]MDG5488896.1 MlaD family protein [Sphingomonas sp. BGYR3]
METRSNHVLVGAVVLILLLVTALFTVWLARLNTNTAREYDIFFRQAVDGIAKGSPVVFSGVPAGQVVSINLYKPDPSVVRVRVSVNEDVPILVGTTAAIEGVGFTGVSQIQLQGATKGSPHLECPETRPESVCPMGVPVIPTKRGGLGALLNSAPAILERLTAVLERANELLSDKNQARISSILANTDRLTDSFADQGPAIAQTLQETQVAIRAATDAANQLSQLAGTSNQLVSEDVRPALKNLNATIASAQRSMEALEGTIGDARPGVQRLTRETLPEVSQLVGELREATTSINAILQKVDRQGAASIIGTSKLPDYDPKGK